MTNSVDTDRGKSRIFRNASYLFVSQAVTWALSLLLAVIVPRHFGPEASGQFQVALSLWTITGILIGFGTDTIITREVARHPQRLNELVGSGMLLRFGFHLVGFAILLVVTWLLGYSRPILIFVAILGISNWMDQLAGMISAAHYGLEEMPALSVIGVLVRLIADSAAIILTLLDFSLTMVIATRILGSILYLGLLWFNLARTAQFWPRPNRATSVWLLRSSAPIIITRLMRNLYAQLDIIIISLLVTEVVVGWYGVADALFGTMLFLPSILGTVLFPMMARMYDVTPAEAARFTRRIFHLMLVVIVPLGLGVTAIAQPVVLLIYGEAFAPAGPVLATFGVVVIFTALNTVLNQQLVAMNREKQQTWLLMLAVVVAAPLDLLLIKVTQAQWQNGAIGGALAYIVTEGLITIGSVVILPAGTLNRSTIWLTLKTGAAGALMVLAAWLTNQYFLAIPILVGVVTYGVLAYLFRLVSRDDQQLISQLIATQLSKLARFRSHSEQFHT